MKSKIHQHHNLKTKAMCKKSILLVCFAFFTFSVSFSNEPNCNSKQTFKIALDTVIKGKSGIYLEYNLDYSNLKKPKNIDSINIYVTTSIELDNGKSGFFSNLLNTTEKLVTNSETLDPYSLYEKPAKTISYFIKYKDIDLENGEYKIVRNTKVYGKYANKLSFDCVKMNTYKKTINIQ